MSKIVLYKRILNEHIFINKQAFQFSYTGTPKRKPILVLATLLGKILCQIKCHQVYCHCFIALDAVVNIVLDKTTCSQIVLTISWNSWRIKFS